MSHAAAGESDAYLVKRLVCLPTVAVPLFDTHYVVIPVKGFFAAVRAEDPDLVHKNMHMVHVFVNKHTLSYATAGKADIWVDHQTEISCTA